MDRVDCNNNRVGEYLLRPGRIGSPRLADDDVADCMRLAQGYRRQLELSVSTFDDSCKQIRLRAK